MANADFKQLNHLPGLPCFPCFPVVPCINSDDMATNNPRPTECPTEKTEHLRLKEAAWHMSVSYNWLYKRIVERKAMPFKRRGGLILVEKKAFLSWSAQDDIP